VRYRVEGDRDASHAGWSGDNSDGRGHTLHARVESPSVCGLRGDDYRLVTPRLRSLAHMRSTHPSALLTFHTPGPKRSVARTRADIALVDKRQYDGNAASGGEFWLEEVNVPLSPISIVTGPGPRPAGRP
jgi:hypothetical protein